MINMLEAAIKKQVEAKKGLCFEKGNSVIGVQSLESLRCNDEVIDYIFIDPPFGSNLNYSELNFLWESWLGVWMNNRSEAIENKVQGKGINEYRKLMTSCFQQAYRVLKPGRWITIEFSNTSAVVWNNIQTALLDAGFIVANVSALDKQTSNHLRKELQDIWMQTHKTIFFITHSVEEAVYLGDKVVVMSGENGGIRNIVPINLERPRHVYDEAFIAYRHKILEEIQGGDY